MDEPLTLDEAALCICNWAVADSNVCLPQAEVASALQEDIDRGGRLPTDEECEELVCGDEEGDTSRVSKLFPVTCATILWQ